MQTVQLSEYLGALENHMHCSAVTKQFSTNKILGEQDFDSWSLVYVRCHYEFLNMNTEHKLQDFLVGTVLNCTAMLMVCEVVLTLQLKQISRLQAIRETCTMWWTKVGSERMLSSRISALMLYQHTLNHLHLSLESICYKPTIIIVDDIL